MLILTNQEKISTIQMKLPLEIGVKINSDDPVVSFKEVMNGVNLKQFLVKSDKDSRGRDGYDPEVLLKIVLFAYMNNVRSTRKIEALCRNDIRFMYLSDEITPSHMTIANFINQCLLENIEDIFNIVTGYIINKLDIDTSKVFIDGTKIEALPNKYTWVWKKACITSRNRKFAYLKKYFNQLNNQIIYCGQPVFPVQEEYQIEEMENIVNILLKQMEYEGIKVVNGKGKRKTVLQRTYDNLKAITDKLREYAYKIDVCGEGRNSYSKTDSDATFMRMKTDYMGNTALLPAYNWQVVTAGEIILYGLTSQSAADNTAFIPLMEKHNKIFGRYPEKAVADAGYGNLSTYDFCTRNGIEKYMKFPSWKRETHDTKFREDPFRSKNFRIDSDGNPVCPNNKKFIKLYDKPIKKNIDHRTEEVYVCESCEGCPFKDRCFKAKNETANRIININKTLTSYHQEVIENLASEEGIQLRKIRSSMSEGTFGIIKQDYSFHRLTRISMKKVNLEFYLIMLGFNLAKYHNVKSRVNNLKLN